MEFFWTASNKIVKISPFADYEVALAQMYSVVGFVKYLYLVAATSVAAVAVALVVVSIVVLIVVLVVVLVAALVVVFFAVVAKVASHHRL